jgi:hypothetical protein
MIVFVPLIIFELFILSASFKARINPTISIGESKRITSIHRNSLPVKNENIESFSEEYEVIIIGSGLAGLSCGALLAHTGHKVLVLESHDAAGGCAHGWERKGYHFESGPSLYSGFSMDKSANPLKNIFQIIGEEPEWITYDRWGTVIPEGKFAAKIGPEEFSDVLKKYGGDVIYY